MKKIIIIGSLLYFISCASFSDIQERLNTWTGQSESTLIQYYGSPIRTFNMEDGTKVYTYGYSRSGVYSTQYNPYQSQNIQSYNYNCTIDFFIKNGIVINWRYEGNMGGCDPLAKSAPSSSSNTSGTSSSDFPISDKIVVNLSSISLTKFGPMKEQKSFRVGDTVYMNLNVLGLQVNQEKKIDVQTHVSVDELKYNTVYINKDQIGQRNSTPIAIKVPIKTVGTGVDMCRVNIKIRDMNAKRIRNFQTKYYVK